MQGQLHHRRMLAFGALDLHIPQLSHLLSSLHFLAQRLGAFFDARLQTFLCLAQLCCTSSNWQVRRLNQNANWPSSPM